MVIVIETNLLMYRVPEVQDIPSPQFYCEMWQTPFAPTLSEVSRCKGSTDGIWYR